MRKAVSQSIGGVSFVRAHRPAHSKTRPTAPPEGRPKIGDAGAGVTESGALEATGPTPTRGHRLNVILPTKDQISYSCILHHRRKHAYIRACVIRRLLKPGLAHGILCSACGPKRPAIKTRTLQVLRLPNQQ
jgi:hypothetical protein